MSKDLEDHQHIEDYRGWALYLTPSYDFLAVRTVGGEEKTLAASSKRELYEKIMARLADDEKLERATWETFEAMDETGAEVIVNGIRKNDGRLLMTPYKEVSYVYPRATYIRLLLERREALMDETREINRQLREVQIDAKPTYGNENYDRLRARYDGVLEQFERANDAARKRVAELASEQVKKSA